VRIDDDAPGGTDFYSFELVYRPKVKIDPVRLNLSFFGKKFLFKGESTSLEYTKRAYEIVSDKLTNITLKITPNYYTKRDPLARVAAVVYDIELKGNLDFAVREAYSGYATQYTRSLPVRAYLRVSSYPTSSFPAGSGIAFDSKTLPQVENETLFRTTFANQFDYRSSIYIIPHSAPIDITNKTVEHTFKIRAKGVELFGIKPRMELWVDRQFVGAWDVGSDWGIYTAKYNMTGGNHTIHVVFTNYETYKLDMWWFSRILYVDYIQIGDEVYQAESADAWFDAGSGPAAMDDQNIKLSSEKMAENGAIGFYSNVTKMTRPLSYWMGDKSSAAPAVDVSLDFVTVGLYDPQDLVKIPGSDEYGILIPNVRGGNHTVEVVWNNPDRSMLHNTTTVSVAPEQYPEQYSWWKYWNSTNIFNLYMEQGISTTTFWTLSMAYTTGLSKEYRMTRLAELYAEMVGYPYPDYLITLDLTNGDQVKLFDEWCEAFSQYLERSGDNIAFTYNFESYSMQLAIKDSINIWRATVSSAYNLSRIYGFMNVQAWDVVDIRIESTS